MRRELFGLSFGLLFSTLVHATVADPTTPYSTATKTNAGVAAALESAITKFLSANELANMGYSMYAEGVNNPQLTQVQNHITSYCSANIPTEATAFGCKVAGSNGTVATAELGDVKASVLLDSTTLNTTDAAIAQTYIKTLLMPSVSSKYREMISNTETFGKNGTQQLAYAKFLGNTALLGLAVYSMENMYSMRAPGSTLGASGSGSSGQSLLSLMESQASLRYTDPGYVDFVMNPSTDDTALLRDMALMQSFNIWMQYQSYRQNERIEALLAAILGKAAGFAMAQDSVGSR